ncbi:hypothetical protein [Natrinema zhouii]|nr:hypothetical protein [Natrinema zhouii]
MALQVLFSYTTLLAILFLIAVGLSSYVGTRVALKQFLDES